MCETLKITNKIINCVEKLGQEHKSGTNMFLFLLHGNLREMILKSQVIAFIKVYDTLYPTN